MKDKSWQPIVQTMLKSIEAGAPWETEPATIPVEEYTSSDRLTAERHMIESSPQVVGLSGDLPENGSYFTRDNLALPLVVMRGEDGVARAFVNVCVHRCARVVTNGRGARQRHTCPFHGWTYANNGKLVGLTSRSSFPHVDPDSEGLHLLPTYEKQGFIWVTLKPPSGDAVQPDIEAFSDDFHELDIAGHEHWRNHCFDLDMNWKLVTDTFMESYHLATLHPRTAYPIFHSNRQINEGHGPHVRSIVPRRNFIELKEQQLEEWDLRKYTTMVYLLFPNSVMLYQKDHIETWRMTPHPTDPTRCTAEFDLYIPKGETSERSNRYWERCWQLIINTILEEDFPAMLGVQQGINSGVIKHLKIGSNETGIKMFHDAINETLSRCRSLPSSEH